MPVKTLLTGVAEGWARDLADLERAGVQVAHLEEKLFDIRQYAIDKHLAGHYCLAGLNEALEHFDLETFEPRYQVPVSVSAVFEISAADETEAYHRVRYLVDSIAYSGSSTADRLTVRDEATQVDQPVRAADS